VVGSRGESGGDHFRGTKGSGGVGCNGASGNIGVIPVGFIEEGAKVEVFVNNFDESKVNIKVKSSTGDRIALGVLAGNLECNVLSLSDWVRGENNIGNNDIGVNRAIAPVKGIGEGVGFAIVL
jgi:hypothetical protein